MTSGNTQKRMSQRLSLLLETEVAISLIESGLAILERSRAYKPKHFSFMLLMATGFERLMKVVLCLHTLETIGEFPSKGYLQGLGHNLIKLRDEIVENCYPSEYLRRPFARTDYEFIKHAPLFNGMLCLLCDFALSQRYVHMDNIANPQGREWPELRWEELERKTMPRDTYLNFVQENRLDELKQNCNRQLVACLEKFVRALTRLFAFADLGSLARSNAVTTWGFMRLADEELGQRNYEL